MAVLSLNHELPPARRSRFFTYSLVLHVAGVILLLEIAQWLPTPQFISRTESVTLLYTPPVIETKPVPKIVPPPPAVLAKMTPPRITPPVEAPKIEPPKVVEPPKPTPVELARTPEPPKPQPKKEIVTGAFADKEVAPTPVRPKKDVVTDSFASGSSAQATLQKPPREVQTGGFGDPNGVKGNSERKGPVTVASLGAFDLPAGAGQGNGTGGTHGTRGTVASAGFGDGAAGNGQGDHQRTGSVVKTGFGEVAAAAAPVPKAHTEEKSNLTPVEILYKPQPIYTQEARQIHLEGEVLVRVTFGASGDLQVQQVVRGLGHGLDEAALHAAQQIKFRPARRNGQPYDSTALVHIVFELAN